LSREIFQIFPLQVIDNKDNYKIYILLSYSYAGRGIMMIKRLKDLKIGRLKRKLNHE